MGFVRPYETRAETLADVLGPEFSRIQRAKAWRHCRRINPRIARQVWITARRREGRFLPRLPKAA